MTPQPNPSAVRCICCGDANVKEGNGWANCRECHCEWQPSALDSPAADEPAPDAEGFAAIAGYLIAGADLADQAEENGLGNIMRNAAHRLRAYAAAQPGEGWKLVPIVPPAEMLNAVGWRSTVGAFFLERFDQDQALVYLREFWRAMLAAAPPAKREGGGT